MAKSFFERITGSVKVREADQASIDAETDADETKKTKPVRNGRGRRPSFKAVLAGAKVESSDSTEPEADFAVEETSTAENPTTEEQQQFATFSSGLEINSGDGEETEEDGELAVDVYDDGSYYVAQSAIGGVRPEDVEISVANNTLFIRGTRKKPYEIETGRFCTQELYWGKFSRAVSFPEDIDEEKTDALFKNGLLTVKIPKRARESTKRVRIKSD